MEDTYNAGPVTNQVGGLHVMELHLPTVSKGITFVAVALIIAIVAWLACRHYKKRQVWSALRRHEKDLNQEVNRESSMSGGYGGPRHPPAVKWSRGEEPAIMWAHREGPWTSRITAADAVADERRQGRLRPEDI